MERSPVKRARSPEQQYSRQSSNQATIFLDQLSDNIILWIETQLDIDNVGRAPVDEDIDEEYSGSLDGDILRVHQIIKSFNADLSNMYDNYVCFQGDRDETLMLRFIDSAYHRAKNAWNLHRLTYKGFNINILEAAKTKLVSLYSQDNNEIVRRERKLIRKIVVDLMTEYTTRLRKYGENNRNHFKRSDVEAIHRRMVQHFIGTIGRITNYGGKLNSVVGGGTKWMESVLNEDFKKQIASLVFVTEQKTVPKPVEPRRVKVEPPKEKVIPQASPVQTYHESMSKEMALQPRFDIISLKSSHEVILQNVTEPTQGKDKEELIQLLDSYWLNMAEYQDNYIGITTGNTFSSRIGLYLTHTSGYLTIYTPTFGNLTITFNGATGKRTNFPALVSLSEYGSAWGYEAERFILENRPLWYHGYLFNFITGMTGSADTATNATTNFLTKMKTNMEDIAREIILEIMLVIPSWFVYSDRQRLRHCCNKAGFRKVTLLTESSAASHQIYRSLPPTPEGYQDPLTVVVIARVDLIRLEIFGKVINDGETTGVKLLAVASEKWIKLDNGRKKSNRNSQLPQHYLYTVRETYTRAVMQLHKNERDSLMYFITISDFPKWNISLNKYFKQEMKLMNVDDTEDLVLGAMPDLLRDPIIVCKFLDSLANNIPNGNAYTQVISKPREKVNREREMIIRKNNILRRCATMEKQIAMGSVQIGKVTRKIIVDAIRQARLAAAEDMVFGEEAKEIDEIFEMYNFKSVQ